MLFPHPAGPVTSQIWCCFAGKPLVDVAPLERPELLSRAVFGEDGMLWRPVDMAPDDEGLCPLIDRGLLYESMATESDGEQGSR